MKMFKIILSLLILSIIISCASSRAQKQGTVQPENFKYKTDFFTAKSVIVLPININGNEKNFLFDTGADFSLIQRDSLLGTTGTFDGASNREAEFGNETIKSLKIGTVDFQNTFALNGDLKGLKEQISNFGGILGQTVINKSNWLIDYPKKTMSISNENLADKDFTKIKIKRKNGAPYTYITIDGEKYKVVIDFGSSSDFNLPQDSKLAKKLLSSYNFKDNDRERYTIGGLQTVTEKVGIIPTITLGDLEFHNVETTINISSQPRIGIGFFKNYQVYIDNLEGNYKVKLAN